MHFQRQDQRKVRDLRSWEGRPVGLAHEMRAPTLRLRTVANPGLEAIAKRPAREPALARAHSRRDSQSRGTFASHPFALTPLFRPRHDRPPDGAKPSAPRAGARWPYWTKAPAIGGYACGEVRAAAFPARCFARRCRCTRRPHPLTKEKFSAPPIAELARGINRPAHFSAVSAPIFAANRSAIRGASFSRICFSAKSLP